MFKPRVRPGDYIGEFTTKHSIVTLLTTSTKILDNDPRRVLIVFSQQSGAATLFVKPETAILATEGLRLLSAGNWHEIPFSEWGAIVCGEWYGRASGAGSPLSVQEVFYDPRQPSQIEEG